MIRKKITDKKTLDLIGRIIDSDHDHLEYENIFTAKKTGIPIGNLTSQLFANVYLNQLDHFVKRRLQKAIESKDISRRYIRYMDDFLLLHRDKKLLSRAREAVGEFLHQELCLGLHPKKAEILPLKNGIDFLGYRTFEPGRPVKLRKSTVFRFKKRMKKYRKKSVSGEKMFQSIQSWKGYAKHADSFRLCRSLGIVEMERRCGI